MSPSNAGGGEPSRVEWGRAYARQARSDWDLYKRLEELGVARCHRVHYLQMASEKIAKAYRFRDTSTSPDKLLSQHVGFAKFFAQFLRVDRVRRMYEGRVDKLAQTSKHCHQLALEIEKLAPAVDADKRPANPEYPWRAGLVVFVPHDHEFPNLSLLSVGGGRTFLELLGIAITEFETIALS